jgi:DNA invertase Pin-like site-specific DNA recombinase
MARASAGPRLRVDGYVRVSQVRGRHGERFISPTVQADDIRRWARERHAVVLHIFEELDESGLRGDRPLLEDAVRRVEAGASDGIVVARLDRFGRSLLHGLHTVERIRTAGGIFVSVQDGFDVTTDTGKLIVRLLLSFAEWDVDRMRSNAEIARIKAIERGAHHGMAPFGYRRSKAGRLRPDSATAHLVGEMFQMRAAGRPLSEIAEWMQSHGVLTRYGNAGWTGTAISALVRNRSYLGEVHSGAHSRTGAHQPLTDAGTWQAAQHPNPWKQARTGREQALLAGMVRCAGCCLSLRPSYNPAQPEYRCGGRSSKGRCPAPVHIRSDVLDAYVESVALELLRHRRRLPVAARLNAREKLGAADAALTRYRDSDALPRVLGDERFTAGLLVRVERVRDARLELASYQEQQALHYLPPYAEIEAAWPTLPASERREIMHSVIDCVFIGHGLQRFSERISVCPVGTGPRKLPTNGYRHAQARPYKPAGAHLSPKRTWALYAWPAGRIDKELRSFACERDAWPSRAEFYAAGQQILYWQIRLSAGERVWAQQLRLPLEKYLTREEPWTDTRIHAALQIYLADKHTWPTEPTFIADGLLTLANAVRDHGGFDTWCPRFPHAPRRRPGQNEAGQ